MDKVENIFLYLHYLNHNLMYKTLRIGFFLTLVASAVNAQKSPIKFGEIPVEDLKMIRYEKDSSASALILCDFGQSALVYNQTDGFSINFERITRIKILSKDGLDWATFQVPLYKDGGDNEKFSSLKAVTYNLENGKIVESKLKSDAVFKEKLNNNIDIMKFTLPNVREGSIVEISYKVNSDFLFNFQDWEFQSTIPIRWSEYRANIPEYFNYDKYMQGYIPLTVNETKDFPGSITITSTDRGSSTFGGSTQTQFNNDKIDFKESRSRWVSQNVPAFKEEPFITTSKDYISKINFELAFTKFPNSPVKSYMGTWADINTLFSNNANFGKEVSGNGFLKKIVEELTVGASTPEQKIAAINNYVKQNIEWNGSSQKYTDTPLKKVLEEKKGSSSEINLILASMLEKAEFNVSPVLISTRDHGFVRETIPISSQFNYVLCLVKVGEKQILLDATDKLLPTGVLPERCLNGNGFVVSERDGFSWVPLKSTIKSKTYYNADLVLNADGELKGKLQADRSGYYARTNRKKYFSKGEGEYVKDLIGGRSWVVEKSEFTNVKEITEALKEVHDVSITDHVTSGGEVIYINPFVVLQEEKNPFMLEKREYPVDFGSPLEKLYICKIAIPEGYAVDEMPQTRLLKLPDNAARYTYSATQTGNAVFVTSNLQINNSLFTQDEYPNLREFYSQVVAKQAEQIVLKKK
jgi:Domain of Unknown Function with PDB structure (DUF3857)/Transglutaminase-like superfamily